LLISPLHPGETFHLIAFPTALLEQAISETKALRKLEQDFYDILESMHDDFVIINKDGVIEKVLPNFEAMYGVSAEEAIGSSVYVMEKRKIFHPSVALRVMKSLKRETLLQYTGAKKYLMCTAIPVFDEKKELKQIISFTRDVTKYESLRAEYDVLQNTLESYHEQLERLKKERDIMSRVAGGSVTLKKVQDMVEKIAKFDATVLFLGESGVGKNMFAEMAHEMSPRKREAFISVNCGAIPEHLMESELFGYERGAFTGANKEGKAGLIELADKGTLFLDEIGDLPFHMQVKLLKVIQEKKVMRVGGVREKEVDFRLIAATNHDIGQMVEQGEFREDLYYRLNVISIHIPPLRERKDDIFPLVNLFTRKYCKQYRVERTLSNKVISALEAWHWPGNIRELENVIERLVLTSEDYMIDESVLPGHIRSAEPLVSYGGENQPLKEILEEVERRVILDCYGKYKTTTKVAEALGISQPSASIKIKKFVEREQEAGIGK
jgi:PAS domain S-box-containing protein